MYIKYGDFRKHLIAIKRIMRLQDKIWDACTEAYDCNLDCEMSFPTLAGNVVELLSKATGDDNDWIGYWVYELDCGEKYSEGTVTDTDGRNIRLKTISDLWDLLCENDISHNKSINT